jgi:integrase/recombinase XerD
MRNIKDPTAPKQDAPKAADVSDVIKIYQTIDVTTQIGRRDRAIIAFLVDTGARAGGTVTLKVSNVDMVNRRAIVTEKGSKARRVMFTEFTAVCIASWMDIRSPVEPLFYNLRTLRPLTVSGLNQLMKRLKKRAGVYGRANPHAMRHAFAREYLKAGGDLATLSRLMGHSDIATTAAYYAVFAQDELADRHDQFSQAQFFSDIDRG